MGNETSLMKEISATRVESVGFLLSNGADPYIENTVSYLFPANPWLVRKK